MDVTQSGEIASSGSTNELKKPITSYALPQQVVMDNGLQHYEV